MAVTGGPGWLYSWLDEYHVTSTDRALRLLNDRPIRMDLLQRAAGALEDRQPLEEPGTSLMAGRGLDLSGDLDCHGWECLRLQVDRLLLRAWHYFDSVAVVGPSALDVIALLENPSDNSNSRFLTFVRLLLYVREIGADALIRFREKPTACEKHWRRHAHEAGLTDLPKKWQPWLESMAKDSDVRIIRQHDDHWHYQLEHPLFEHTQWGVINRLGVNEKASSRAVVRAVGRRFYAALSSDVAAARECNMPMGSAVRAFEELLRLNGREVFPEDVAFRITLPVLEGVDPKTLIEIRVDEADAFKRCQASLRIAIHERIGRMDSQNPDRLAREIEQDVITPTIADLNRRLESAQRILMKKTALSVGLGVMTTTFGLLVGVPSSVAAQAGGGAALASSIPGLHKYFENLEDIRMSDLYFVWAGTHANQN